MRWLWVFRVRRIPRERDSRDENRSMIACSATGRACVMRISPHPRSKIAAIKFSRAKCSFVVLIFITVALTPVKPIFPALRSVLFLSVNTAYYFAVTWMMSLVCSHISAAITRNWILIPFSTFYFEYISGAPVVGDAKITVISKSSRYVRSPIDAKWSCNWRVFAPSVYLQHIRCNKTRNTDRFYGCEFRGMK